LTRTFVGGRFSKGYELLANEYVGFFALLSSGHGPLLGYIVFVFLASNLEYDYLGLLAVLEASEEGSPGAGRPAQPPALSAVW